MSRVMGVLPGCFCGFREERSDQLNNGNVSRHSNSFYFHVNFMYRKFTVVGIVILPYIYIFFGIIFFFQ